MFWRQLTLFLRLQDLQNRGSSFDELDAAAAEDFDANLAASKPPQPMKGAAPSPTSKAITPTAMPLSSRGSSFYELDAAAAEEFDALTSGARQLIGPSLFVNRKFAADQLAFRIRMNDLPERGRSFEELDAAAAEEYDASLSDGSSSAAVNCYAGLGAREAGPARLIRRGKRE